MEGNSKQIVDEAISIRLEAIASRLDLDFSKKKIVANT